MDNYQGYGFDVSTTKTTETAYEDLYKKIMASDSFLKEKIHEYYEDHKANENESEEEHFYDFCESYYENDIFLWHGIEGVLTDFINEQVYNNKVVFQFEDCCYHVEATLPKNEKEREIMPTQEGIKEIIETWIAPYYTHIPEIEWKTINHD